MNKKILICFLIITSNLFKLLFCEEIIDNSYINNSFNDLINKKYKYAEKQLEKINEDYLICNELQKYLIQKLFINYKLSNLNNANKIASRILKLSNDKYIDYVLYMKGLINLKLDENLLIKTLNYNFFSKNDKYIKKSLYYFNEIVTKHKKSKYYDYSLNRIIYIKQRLFIHDLSIIDFYFKKKLYISVINRSIDLLNFFSEEPYVYYVMVYIKKSCVYLNLNELNYKLDLIINNNKSSFKKLKINI